MLWETWRYVAGGRIERLYLEPIMLFKYYGFGWIEPWPGDGMYWHFVTLGVASACVMVGLFYRLSAVLVFTTFTYIFLLEQAKSLNHFYLLSLVSLLMIFVPANRALSLDARIAPGQRSDVVPAWTIWLLRAQVGIPYLYGAFAKMNVDWVNNQPVRMWLAQDRDRMLLWDGGFPLGELLTSEWFVQFMTWGGLVFDLLIVPALLWRRTRTVAFAVCVGFHLCNALVFTIGVFPWFMIAATTIFFEPDWPRRANLLFAPLLDSERQAIAPFAISPVRQRITLALLGIYLTAQLLIPFRHFLLPGNVHWNGEGARWSWHMMLRDMEGRGKFIVKSNGKIDVVDPNDYLTGRQVRKMICDPDMILQFAHFLAAQRRDDGHEDVEVYARIHCSLNGRPPQPFIDPAVNLAAEQRTLWHLDWVLPLEQ